MKTTKPWKTAVAALALALALGACGGDGAADTPGTGADGSNGTPADGAGTSAGGTVSASGLPVLAEAPYKLAGTQEGVTEFETLNTDYQSPYQNDSAVNISPSFLTGDTGFQVFKYTLSNETFLVYDGAVYPIGGNSNGDGVTSMALADFTGDGTYELYYAYSEGSASSVGCFDPAKKEASDFTGVVNGSAVVLAADGGQLNICKAEVSGYESLTSMTLTPGEVCGSVQGSGGEVGVNMVDATPVDGAADTENAAA